jgi:hypothetical protein
MRSVDVSCYRLICSGMKLDDRFLHTSSNQWKQIAMFLEKKEIYCTWFQPSHGDVDDQFPLLKIHDQYYNIPLRIQKHIFRHIRLSSSFVNREVTPNGLIKLRIPRALLLEKQRTARRFMVRTPILIHTYCLLLVCNAVNFQKVYLIVVLCNMLFLLQNSRTLDPDVTTQMPLSTKNKQAITETEDVKQNKTRTNLNKRGIKGESKQDTPAASTSLIQELVAQLMPTGSESLPDDMNFTCFEFDTAEHLMLSVLYIQQDCPDIMGSKNEFIDAMSHAYDKAQTVERFQIVS